MTDIYRNMSDFQRTLETVKGYLGLGMVDDAIAEIESLHRLDSKRVEVLGIKVALYRQAEEWEKMKSSATDLLKMYPDDPEIWVSVADAVRNGESLQAGISILSEAEKKFTANPHIQFQLGCYTCQAGDFEKAKHYVLRAAKMDPIWAKIALQDEDLRGVWNEIQSS